MNTKNPEIQNINPIDAKLNFLGESTTWNIQTIEFCKSLKEDDTNKLVNIFNTYLA